MAPELQPRSRQEVQIIGKLENSKDNWKKMENNWKKLEKPKQFKEINAPELQPRSRQEVQLIGKLEKSTDNWKKIENNLKNIEKYLSNSNQIIATP